MRACVERETERGWLCVRRTSKRDGERIGSDRPLVERRCEREGRSGCERDSFQSVSLERGRVSRMRNEKDQRWTSSAEVEKDDKGEEKQEDMGIE